MENEINLREYIEKYLYIRTKKGELKLLKMNEAQRDLYNTIFDCMEKGNPVRIIILKARQLGFSTLIEAIFFALTTLNFQVHTGIMTHSTDTTSALLTMFKRFYAYLPDYLKPEVKATNANEVIYNTKTSDGLDSSIKCMTATPDGVGRGFTYDYLHLSEMTSWKGDVKDIYTTLMQCVPNEPHTIVVNESTAQGYDFFKDLWDDAVAGKNDFIPKFYAWYKDKTYRRTYYGFSLTKEEEELKKEYFLDNEQLSWRRWKIANDCAGDINKFKQEYPSCPEEAFIASGKCIYDLPKLTERLKTIKKPIKKGYFKYDYIFDKSIGIYGEMTIKNPVWVGDQRGEINIYEEPKKNYPYVIGCDTAGDGSDSSVACVLDNTNSNQVCTFSTTMDTDLFIKQIMCLAIYYNKALVGIETNFDPSSVKILEKLGYDNQYKRVVEDKITQSFQEKYGFKTTTLTRPLIITRSVEHVRDHTEYINDYETIIQMETFVKNESGKPEAIKGKHDDFVMAYCISLHLFACDQQSHDIKEEKENNLRFNWIEDSMKKAKKKGEKNKWW